MADKTHNHSQDTGKPLRILQVLETSGGGSGRHFLDLSKTLIEKGHDVSAVYSPLRAEERFLEELADIPFRSVHAVPMKRAPHPSDVKALFSLWKIIRQQGPFDIIHGHSSKAGLLTRLRLPGIRHTPRIYTPHAFRTMDPTLGRNGRKLFGAVESLLGRYFSDKVICVSKDEYRHALDLGIPAHLLATVINGVEKPETACRNEIRQKLGLKDDHFVFGFVGRLAHQKAPERLVEAFARIGTGFPNARLVIIGFGELEAKIKMLIENFKIADKVAITSEIPGNEAMQAFDVLVMPSRYEAMSYAMLEAGAAGKPMILSDVGGATIVVDDNQNGRIIENSEDPQELAMAMLEFADPNRAAAYALEAYRREDRYQLSTMVDQTLTIYREALGLAPMSAENEVQAEAEEVPRRYEEKKNHLATNRTA